MPPKRIILTFFVVLSILGGTVPAFSAKDYNIKSDTTSFLFVSGTSGNVGIGSTTPIGRLEVRGGTAAPSRIVNINGTFADLAGTRTGLYTDVTVAVTGAGFAAGSWSEVRTTADTDTYNNGVAGVYAEALHSGAATATDLMGVYALVNQTGSGPVTNAYGVYPQIWKGTGTVSNAYGVYYQGVPDANGDTGNTTGTLLNQYGVSIGHLTMGTTRNIGLFLDDNTGGAATTGDFGILQEATEPNSFAGNIGIGTTAVNAPLVLYSPSATLIDVHENADMTGANTIETHYRVGESAGIRTTPSDVQRFRFFAGTGGFQEVVQMNMNTPAPAFGVMDIHTRGADGLVKRMTIDEHKAMFAMNVGIGTSEPEAKLHIGDTGSAPDAMLITGNDAYIEGNLEVDGKIYGDGSELTGISGAIMGLTATRVPVASSPTTLVDSVIYEVGGNIGIGVPNPAYRLDLGATQEVSVIRGYSFLLGTVHNYIDQLDTLAGSAGVGEVAFYGARSIGLRTYGPHVSPAVLRTIQIERQDQSYAAPTDITNSSHPDPTMVFRSSNIAGTDWAAHYLNTTTGYHLETYDENITFSPARIALMTITSAGNVGIGTAEPAAKLHVGDTGSAPSAMSITGMDGYIEGNLEVDGRIYGDGGGLTGIPGTISGLTATRVPVASGAMTLVDSLIYEVGGNIGIGTANPADPFHVVGNARIDGTPYSGQLAYLTFTAGGSDAFISSRGGANSLILAGNNGVKLARNAGLLVTVVMGGNDNVKITRDNSTAGTMEFSTDNTERMRIDPQGNVGMGTTAPASKLDVVGSAHVLSSASTANIGYATTPGSLYIQQDLEVDGNVYLGDLITDSLIVAGSLTLAGSTNYAGPVSISTTDTTAFVVRQQAGGTQVFNVDTQSGNVGVGTAAPRALLEVGAGATIPAGSSPAGLVEGNLVVDGTVYATLFLGQLELGMTTGSVVFEGPTGMTEDNANFFWDDTTNRLGIGTTNPGSSLDIYNGAIEFSGTNAFIAGKSRIYTIGSLSLTYEAAVHYFVGTGGEQRLNIGVDGVGIGGATAVQSPALYVQNNAIGNVGIGTAAPVAKLHVGDAGSAPSAMSITGMDAYIEGNLEVDGRIYGDGSGLTGITAANPTANNVPKSNGTALIDSSIYEVGGNVGIGVIAPTYTLDINTPSFVGAESILRLRVSDDATSYMSFINGVGSNGSFIPSIIGQSGWQSHEGLALTGQTLNAQDAGTRAVVTFTAKHDGFAAVVTRPTFQFLNYLTPQMTILPSGFIGIGTTVPRALLEVGIAAAVPAGSSPAEIIKGDLVVDGKIYGDGSGLTGITAANPTVNNIPKSNGTALIDSSIYEVGGNVGIGTTAPEGKLHVEGSSNAVQFLLRDKLSTGQTGALFFNDLNNYIGFTIYGSDYVNPAYRNLGSVNSTGDMQFTTSIGVATGGTGTFKIVTGGYDQSPSFYVAAGSPGNIGIGTTLPVARLHVGDTGSVPNAMSITGMDAYIEGNLEVDGRIYGDGSGLTGISGALSGLTATRVPVASGATTLVDSGIYYVGSNTGVGEPSPLSKLHINGGTGALSTGLTFGDGDTGIYEPGNDIFYFNFGGTAYYRMAGSTLEDRVNPNGWSLRTEQPSSTNPVFTFYDDLGTGMGRAAAGVGSLVADSINVLNWNSNGNVGIGTLAPTQQLEITNSFRLPVTTSASVGVIYSGNNRFLHNYGTSNFFAGAGAGNFTTTGSQNVAVGVNSFTGITNGSNNTVVGYLSRQGNGGQNTALGGQSLGSGGTLNNDTGIGYQAGLSLTSGSTSTFLGYQAGYNALQKVDAVNSMALGSGTYTTADNQVVIGNTSVTQTLLNGNIGLGTTVPRAILEVGAAAAIPAGSSPAEVIKGDLVVDGKIYGDGSQLTNLPAGISGLTATRIPVASSSTTLVDSLIYEVSGNIGIGTSLPGAALDVSGVILMSDGSAASPGLGFRSEPSLGFYRSTPTAIAFTSGGSLRSYMSGSYSIISATVGAPALTVNAGGITTPSYTFNNDGDTGLSRPGDNQISLITSGVSRIYLSDSGNIGLGTSEAQAALHIGGGGAFPNAMSVTGSDAYITGNLEIDGRIYGDGSGLTGISGAISGLTATRVPVASNSTTLIDSAIYEVGGNVGIGVANPLAPLHLYGNAVAPTLITLQGSDGQSSISEYTNGVRLSGGDNGYFFNNGGVTIGNSAYTQAVNLRGSGVSVDRVLQVNGTGNSYFTGNLGVGTALPLAKLDIVGTGTTSATAALVIRDSSNASKVTILDNGNVGIGTSSPSYKLDINGGVNTTIGPTGGYKINTNRVVEQNSTIISFGWVSGRSNIQVGTLTGIGFRVGDVDNRIVIADSGNLGIGTADPVARLHVGDTGSVPDAMSITGMDTYIEGNLEVDGRIYGDGSGLTGISGAISGLTATRVPVASNSTTLIDSSIYNVGENVGIGSALPSRLLDVAGDVGISTTGVIYKGADRFIHNFQHPTGQTQAPVGHNTFVGINAGNLTMGSTATETYRASNNSALGYGSLANNANGYGNSAVGYTALASNTDGFYNAALGAFALSANNSGVENTAVGATALYFNNTGSFNTAVGASALGSKTSGDYNSALGQGAGDYLADGATQNSTPSSSVFLGANTRASGAGETNQIVIGTSAIGAGSNSVVLGNDSITRTALKGNVGIGTAAPVAKLHVGDAGSAPNVMSITGMDAYIEGNLEVDGRIYGDGSGLTNLISSQWTTTGNDIYYNTGNVGVSTTAPSSFLEINRNSIGTSSSTANGILLSNNTVATSGNNQYSPPLTFRGNAWDDTVNEIVNFPLQLRTQNDVGGVTYRFWLGDTVNIANSGTMYAGWYNGQGATLNQTNSGIIQTALSVQSAIVSVTSGTYNVASITSGIDPSSGTTVLNTLNIAPTVNQTGGANGITRGIYLNPTLTSAYDWRGIEIANNSGFGVYQSGASANNYFSGNIGVGTTAPAGQLQIGTSSGANSILALDGTLTLRSDEFDATKTVLSLENRFSNFNPSGAAINFNLSNNVNVLSVSGRIISAKEEGWSVAATRNSYMAFNTTSQDVNSEKLRITSAGNVAIGTNAPGARLHVANDTSMPNAMPITGSDLYVRGNIEFDGKIYGDGSGLTGLGSGISGLTATRVPVASSPTTLVDSMIYSVGNNVGIGTTAPVGTFQVSNASAVDALIIGANGSAGFGMAPVGGTFQAAFDGAVWVDDEIKGRSISSSYDAGGYGLASLGYTGSDPWYGTLDLNANGETRVHLDANTVNNYINSGNLGIGTTVPVAKLDMVGNGTTSATSALIIRDSGRAARVAVLDNGNVGIGTVSPMSPLTIDRSPGSVNWNALTILNHNVASGQRHSNIIFHDGAQTVAAIGNVWTGATNRFDFHSMYNGGARTDNDITVSILGNGRVGIGTTLPAARLHVGDAGDAPNAMSITGSDTYIKGNLEVDGRIYGDGSGLTGLSGSISGLTATRMPVASSSTTLIDSAIYSVGSNIGIGTTNPDFTLVLAGNTNATAQGPFYIRATNPSGMGVGFVMDASVTTSGKIYSIGSFGGGAYLPGALSFYDSSDGNYRLTIGPTGNVIIGNLTGAGQGPANLLSVKGNASIGSGYSTIAGPTDGLIIQSNVGIGTTVPTALLQVGVDPVIPSGSSPAEAVKGNLVVDGRIYGDQGLNIAGTGDSYFTGNVGVGATAPAYELDVNGTVRATAFIGDGTGITNVNANLANPTGTIGLTAVNGTATTAMRSDAAPALSVAITPTWTGTHRFSNATNSALFTGGNVGVGTTTPLALLGIGTTSPTIPAGSLPIAVVKGNFVVDGKIYGDGSGLTGLGSGVSGLTATRVPVASSATTIVDSGIYEVGGNVGIGTSAPLEKMSLAGDIGVYSGSTRTLRIQAEGGTGGEDLATAAALNAVGNLVIAPNFNGSAATVQLSAYVSDGNGWRALLEYANGSRDLLLVKSRYGNVGVGTTTPAARLDVDGTIYSHGNVGIGTHIPMDKLDILNGNIVFSGPDNGALKSVLWRTNDGSGLTGAFVRADPGFSSVPMEIGDFGSVQVYIDTNNNDTSRYFSVHNNVATGNTNELFRVQEDGNVGIGTTAPVGNLHARRSGGRGQVTIDGTNGGCLMIRDTDGTNWTECYTSAGTLTCSADADGVCDGS